MFDSTPRVVVAVALLLLASAAPGATKDLTILSGGRDINGVLHEHYPAIPYTRPADADAQLRALSASLAPLYAAQPCRPMPWMGMSNAQQTANRFKQLFQAYTAAEDGFKDLRRCDRGKQVGECSMSDHTAPEWSDPLNDGWTHCVNEILTVNVANPDDVLVGFITLTTAFPVERGMMTAAQVQQIGDNFKANFRNARLLVVMTLEWTGQSNYLKRAPIWSVWQDQQTLIDSVGMRPDGLFIDYMPIYADGNVPNPDTATSLKPAHAWFADDIASDGVHYLTPKPAEDRFGTDKTARTVLGKMFDDPSYWFLWAGTQPPQ